MVNALEHEPSDHPMKEKAEDENEDEGCRRGFALATDYRLLGAVEHWPSAHRET